VAHVAVALDGFKGEGLGGEKERRRERTEGEIPNVYHMRYTVVY
jgi:hypothetical protein